MASIEKLVKAFEALKVIQTPIDKPEEALVSTRFIKRETSLTKKDKAFHCNTIADIICCPSLRNIEDFHKFLGITIETLLACCDDSDSDVRMIANECLNRTIKNLLDTQLGRIQVELYKEIKKNGSSRSLRAALSRFADLCHLTRPAKCRPYVLNLFPCLVKMSERTEEDLIQETLRIAITKIMPVLAGFATDNEIISLLTAFLPNLQFVMSSVRRTAASSLVVICENSRKPQIFFSWLLSHLLKSLNQMTSISESKDIQSDQQNSDRVLVGIFLCLKHMIPHLYDIPSHIEFESLKTFGISQKQRESIAKDYDSITENLLQIYELILHNIRYNNNHNVILSSLEALLQLMKTPPKLILPYLIDSKGIDKSRIGTYIRSSPASPSMLSLHRHNRRMQSNNSMSCSSINVESLGDDEEVNICGVTSLDDKADQNINYSETNFQAYTVTERFSKSVEDINESDITSEHDKYEPFVEMNQIDSETAFALESETNSIKNMDKYSSTSFQVTKLTYVDCEDSFDLQQLSPSTNDSFDAIEQRYNNGDIGEFTSENIPSLEYCTRLLSSQFLLTGSQSNLIPDRIVRVSVKSLALGCIAAIIRLYPKSLIIEVYLEMDNISQKPGESPQKVWDILLFATHSDPQLRGQIAIIIGNFIHEVLKQPKCYNEFLLLNCSISAYPEAPSLEELVKTLFTIISDKNSSSMAVKHGLSGLKLCFRSLLESNDSINLIALSLIDQLIELKHNPYWLVKAELVDVLSDLPYKTIAYLELSSKTPLQRGIIVKQESIQEKIVNYVFITLISDEDFRVRDAASVALLNLIPSLFTPLIHIDNEPITAIAFEHTIKNLPERTKSYQDFDNLIPPIRAFTDPLNFENFITTYSSSLEANLSNIVKVLLNSLQFNLDDKHALIGYCNALSLLSDKYTVSEYPNAWECDLSDKSSATQLLNIAMTLLSANTTVVLDLNTHQNVLTLTANILEGLSYNLIKTNSKMSISVTELEWGVISSVSPYLASQLETLFNHLLKILNIYSYIIDESFTPTNILNSITSNNKIPVIQTLSSSPLSPIRKKPIKQSSDLLEKSEATKKGDSEKSDKDKSTKLQFTSNSVFLKLFETLRASYLSGKTSMDLKSDKISSLLNVTLNIFSQLLEIATIKYISKYSEELLHYLKVVFTLEPSLAVKNVRQLLKCIFGTNFAVMFTNDSNQDSNDITNDAIGVNNNSFSNRSSLIGNNQEMCGLYNCCLSSPNTKFTQFYASMTSRMSSSFGSSDETDLTFTSWLRRKVEKRVSMILDKNTSINTSINQNTKAALTSHIRLFEPVVIKALKQYTITSDISLQCEVLDLLSQLVQLRVNYCLLDSEQIFIGFVLKQFEFIESGQFDRYDQLIGHIFFFLILLSYERYHSKPIIGIPKIIQLCDGIIASGQHPEKFALPSLQSIVEDLILLRNASKVDSSKELEAQREVIVANCLKLVQFPHILQILLIVTKQSKKDGEEKWKKISRQIVDNLLPQLVKQTIHIDSYKSLDILHSLFESVSPSVFRPVDILLKALFAAPQPHIFDNYYFFHRWTSMILVILRLLIVQVKEEVVLARLEELKGSIVTIGPFGLPVIPTSSFSSTNSIPFHMSSITNQNEPFIIESEEMFASYLLQIIQLCSHEICIRRDSIYSDIINHSNFLVQQLANYMLILTHMFQSGSFCRVAKAAMALIKKSQFQETSDNRSDNNNGNSYYNGFSLESTNSSFMTILATFPTLALQWFNLLILLNYEDNNEDGLWNKLIRPNDNGLSSLSSKSQSVAKRRGSAANKVKNAFVFSPSYEIVRKGSLVLFCDFVCENMNDAEHMTWLIVQNINEIIKMSHELPVSEFISAIHRNSASSGLFIQAINARCDDNLKIPSFLRRLLRCLERVHPSQSASLMTFLIEKIISNSLIQGNYLLTHNAEDLACNRLNLIMSSIESFPHEITNQISVQDLDKLVSYVNTSKYSNLISKLESFKAIINDSNISQDSQTSHPLIDSDLIWKIPNINKDWFLSILNKYCQKHSKGHRAAYLLNKLSYDDIISVLSSKDFALEILGNCIEFGDQSLIDEDDKSNTKIMFSAVMNRINLLKASLNTVVLHVNYFVNLLPLPHNPFLSHSEMSTPKEARHRDKIIELFQQSDLWNHLFKLSLGFLSFLEHHCERTISPDLLKNITRIAILYSETAQYMTEVVENTSFTHVIVVLKIMRATMNCNSIFAYLSDPENISYQCTIISAIHSFAQHFFGELPKLEEPESFVKSEKENPEWKHPHKACIRLAQLISFIENNKYDSTHIPSIISSLIKKITLSTARLPLVNSFVMVPTAVWSHKYSNAWNPVFSGDFGTVVPTIPSEFLHDKEILDQFSFRIMRLGWICRVQFEEVWMSLLGVLGATSANTDQNEDQSERINISLTSAKAISELLLLSTLSPQPGNPIRSKFIKQKNEKLPTFLHAAHGVKLQLVREPLSTAINTLLSSNNEIETNNYDLGQISVELLRVSLKSTSNANELSPSVSSTSSSSEYSPLSPINISSAQEKLEIDLNSCLHFLLDLYGQLLTSQQQIQLPLLTEICRSTVLLSDLFNDKTQFEWLLETFLELHRISQISEDEIMTQYLIVGICKSAAVLGLEQELIVDKCKKCIEISLKSHFLPTRIATLHGLKYLLEFRGLGFNGKETLFLPIASDYLLKHLSDNTLPSSHNLEHVQQMWKIAFHLIENFVEDFSESDFGQKIFQLSLKVLTDKNSKVYHLVVNGLEHLILCEKFSIKESNLIVKSALDRFKSSNCQIDALMALRLISSSTYFVGSVGLDLEKNIDDSEEFLLAMEKLSVIFERLKNCLSFEAQQICNVLPHFLCEFFPTQDILNKCIGEFLSGQQTHAKHLANILFVVFNKLQIESRLDLVHDWVILSLSSFTQLNPLSHAIWSLTSFIISASINPWIRYTFPYVQTRFGILENSDRELFFIVCHNFYNELKTDQNREAFRTTFQSVAEINSPYSDVLKYLQISKS